MRKGNKLIEEGKVPKKRTLNTQVLTDIVNGYYLDGIEAGYKAGYDYGYEVGKKDYDQNNKQFDLGYNAGYENGARCQDEVQYQKGLDDAWEAARKIYAMTANETIAVFGGCSKWVDYSAIEAIEKIRAYEEKQKQEEPQEIKIGDEVIYNGNAPHKGEKGFVIGLCGEWVEVRYLSSWNCVGVHIDTLTKTGRHFDEIENVMEQMRGEA